MQPSTQLAAIVLASVFTATTMNVADAEASLASTSEKIITQAKRKNLPSEKRGRRTRRQPVQSTRPTRQNQESQSIYNQAFLAGLGVAHACGYSRRSNISACSTLDNSISILSNGCAEGDKNACQWVQELHGLEHAGRMSSEIRSF